MDFTTGYFTGSLNNLHDGIAVPRAQIQELGLARLLQEIERTSMGISEIDDMNVVADGRPIRCEIPISKDLHFRPFAILQLSPAAI